MLPKINEEYITEDGVKVKTFNVEIDGINFISPDAFKGLLNDIKNNLPHYIAKDFFSCLTIEIWNDLRDDIPNSKNNYMDIGDPKYLGLTYIGQNLIKLESKHYEDKEEYIKYMSNLLSHEIGHYFAEYIGYFNKNTIMYNELEYHRGRNESKNIILDELIAEDFRILFGSKYAKDYERGNYKQATELVGYKQFLEIYKFCDEYLLNIQKDKRIDKLTFNYDNNSFYLMYCEKNKDWWKFWDYKWVYISKYGVFNYINNNWVKVQEIK